MKPIRSKNISRLTRIAILGAVLVGSMLAPSAALAGKPASNCAPAFSPGLLDVEQSLTVSRSAAAIADGFYTEAQIREMFAARDRNGDGYLCFKEPAGAFIANDASLWQYLYVVHDNTASKR